MIQRIANVSTVTGENWLQLSAEMEKEVMGRLYSIQKHGTWKKKNERLIAKGNAYKTVTKEFSENKMNHDEYIRKIGNLNKKLDIPKGRKSILRLLEDSEEEE